MITDIEKLLRWKGVSMISSVKYNWDSSIDEPSVQSLVPPWSIMPYLWH